jgi:hypothetical protein
MSNVYGAALLSLLCCSVFFCTLVLFSIISLRCLAAVFCIPAAPLFSSLLHRWVLLCCCGAAVALLCCVTAGA